MAEMYVTDEVDAVYAIYNEFKNVMVQRLCVEKLLPIDPAVLKEGTYGEGRAVGHRPRSGERILADEAVARWDREPGRLHLRATGG